MSTTLEKTAPVVGRRPLYARRGPRDIAAFIALAVVVVVIAFTAPTFRVFEWSSWAAFGILALSFTFVWGRGGIFSFGQAAFFGIGAYVYGIVGINLSSITGETISALIAGAVVAALVAAAIGYFMFYGNVGDVYVAIITLAVSLVCLTVMRSTAGPEYRVGDAMLGGYNGMIAIPPIMIGGGRALDTTWTFVFSALIALVVAFAINLLSRRPFGRILAAVRENELRTKLLGYDVRLHKLLAFSLGGLIAGLGGGLYAAWGLIVNPAVFGLAQAALVAIWVLVGGRSSIIGAFVGVIVVQGLSSGLGASAGQWTPVVLGAVMIFMVLVLPNGLVPSASGAVRRLLDRRSKAVQAEILPVRTESRASQLAAMMADRDAARQPLSIEGRDLTKRFGGVNAVRGVDLKVAAGGIQALIGPNGAGKSTTFNMLAGRYAPTSGRVFMGEEDVTKLRADERARRGLGIKLQVASYFAELSVHENLWLASYASRRDVAFADAQTVRALEWLGMTEKAHHLAKVLSHGEHQWLEIGMVVAGQPSILLLDEPTAGMTREQTQATVEMIHELSEHMTIIVVEHDMDFLRALDVPVTMFHQGLVFVEGNIEDLRRDDRVLDTYLGRRNSDAAN